MNIKSIIEKIKSIFTPSTKSLEARKDRQYRIECEKDGRMKSYEDYLLNKKAATDDINRFQKYIEDGTGDVERWKYDLKTKQRELEFIRPNDPKDIRERNYWRSHFYEEFLKVAPENIDLRFHGTPIYNAKAIIESGGIFSSVDINDGYRASTDLSGEISASTTESLDRLIDGWFADFGAYFTGLPCGCVFVLNPRTEKDEELKQYDAMESVNFKEHPEQLYSIFTSTENLENVRTWLKNAELDPNLVCNFEGFLEKIKNEKEKSTDFRETIAINDNEIKDNLEEVIKKSKYKEQNNTLDYGKDDEKRIL